MATARACELSDKHRGEPASRLDAITALSPALKYNRSVHVGIQTLDGSAEIVW